MKFIVKNPRSLRAIPKLKTAKVGEHVELDEKEARLHVRRGALMRARLPLKQYQKQEEIKEEKQDVKETIEKPRRKKSGKKSRTGSTAV